MPRPMSTELGTTTSIATKAETLAGSDAFRRRPLQTAAPAACTISRGLWK